MCGFDTGTVRLRLSKSTVAVIQGNTSHPRHMPDDSGEIQVGLIQALFPFLSFQDEMGLTGLVAAHLEGILA